MALLQRTVPFLVLLDNPAHALTLAKLDFQLPIAQVLRNHDKYRTEIPGLREKLPETRSFGVKTMVSCRGSLNPIVL